MGKPTGFIEYRRKDVDHRPVAERVKDFLEVDLPLSEETLRQQAARCMDCGIPFCHGVGCPLGNVISEFNDLLYRGRWREAAEVLHATNNFPEITGRICPALCEASCTLNINDDPVLIRHIECRVAERAWAEGWVQPRPARRKTGKRVAIVGSGPAGLAAAQQLARAGHGVVVFEKGRKPGGLMRYGIPDFKLDKRLIDRRLEQLSAEGVEFQTGVAAGEDISPGYLRRMFDAICLTMGAGQPRDLPIEGRQLDGIHFAMDFLTQQNRLNAGEAVDGPILSAAGKTAVVLGGGDTGSDCVGTSIRQHARRVHQLEILPEPPRRANPQTPWPQWPRILRTSTSHEEGCDRRWSVMTKRFTGEGGRVKGLEGVAVEWVSQDGRYAPNEVPGSEFTLAAELVLLALGFVHVAHSGLVEQLDLKRDGRGNVQVDDRHMTSVEGVFSAGDTVTGASLVVRGIQAGRDVAEAIDRWLMER